MLLGIIIGILIWQAITTLAVILSNENEGVIICVGGGIPTWIIMGVCFIIRKVLNHIRYGNTRSVVIDSNGNWCYTSYKKVRKLEEEGVVKFPSWTDELKEKYPKSMWNEYQQKQSCSAVGNFRYSPKEIWSQFPKYKV